MMMVMNSVANRLRPNCIVGGFEGWASEPESSEVVQICVECGEQ